MSSTVLYIYTSLLLESLSTVW